MRREILQPLLIEPTVTLSKPPSRDVGSIKSLKRIPLEAEENKKEMAMKFVSGIVVGLVLAFGVVTVSAQNERALHPRIAKAIEALKDARAYMEAAPHDFGGHRVEAIKASDDAIRQLQLALAYRAGADHKKK
jgi:hypothetical protein